MNVTVAVWPMALPAIVPLTVAVPAELDEIRTARYVPLWLSLTVESVPRVVASVTVPPEPVRLFPLESFA